MLLKILFIITVLLSALLVAEKTKVFILHSYSHEYQWTKNQHEAFISTLQGTDKTFEFYIEYLDTKRHQLTHTYKNEMIQHINAKYKDISPDLVYVTDDNALNFIHENYTKIFKTTSTIPVFFSGVNNLTLKSVLPTNIYRGVYEKKKIQENIELIKQFSPQTRDIYIIGDNSGTYKSIQKNIQDYEKYYSNIKFHYITDLYLSKVIKHLDTKVTKFAILTTIGNFKNDSNTTMQPKESIHKLKEYANLNILTMEDAYMYEGVIGGYVTSANRQGSEAANLVLKYLEMHSLENITSVDANSNIYIFDAKELMQARVLLSEYIRRISIIKNKEKNFIDNNKLMILQILTIASLIIIFALTAIYAIQRKKHLEQTIQLMKMDKFKDKLETQKILLHKVIQKENLAYWSLSLATDALYLSKELVEKLQIEIDIYKDDKDLLSYFIHSNDKKLFFENIEKIKEEKNDIHFHHKIINSHNELFSVEHLLYFEATNNHSGPKIIGVLKFED